MYLLVVFVYISMQINRGINIKQTLQNRVYIGVKKKYPLFDLVTF